MLFGASSQGAADGATVGGGETPLSSSLASNLPGAQGAADSSTVSEQNQGTTAEMYVRGPGSGSAEAGLKSFGDVAEAVKSAGYFMAGTAVEPGCLPGASEAKKSNDTDLPSSLALEIVGATGARDG